MPTFRKDLHLGHEVPMIDSDDINNKVILGRHIADRVIDWFHIIARVIRNEHIADGAVDTRTLADKSVTPEKLSDRIVPEVIDPLLQDLQNQIASIEVGGKPMSNELGNDPEDKMIGVSKWYLTELFNRLWAKISEITGEVTQGISMVVTPTYFMGDEGCNVHITARTNDTTGIFEKIFFYWNNSEEPFAGSDVPTELFEADATLTETAVIKCRAKILGIWYEAQEIITHNDIIWIGAGTQYSDVFNDAHKHTMDRCCWRANYDVPFSNGNKLFIIMGDAASRNFQRADMNGIEIAFTQSTFTDASGNTYKVFTSVNTYQAGTINVDING